jgi:beta-lactamase class A
MGTVVDSRLAGLRATVQRHIDDSGATIGVGIQHLPSGAELFVHADELFPLASVVKIPILIEALAQVDEGRLTLDMRIPLRDEDKVLPSGILVFLNAGLQPTLHDLLTLMIIISDNTATDMVLRQIGIETVEPRMQSFGCDDITVRMTIQQLFDVTFGPVDALLLPYETSREIDPKGPFWEKLTNQRVPENNVSSPRAMCRLLSKLVSGELLSPGSTRVALDIMLRQQLSSRLPRFMLGTVPFAHKTGTFIQSRNDAGVVSLPDGTHLIVTTYAILDRALLDADPLQSVPYIDRVDSAMGYIARSAYDAFTATDK